LIDDCQPGGIGILAEADAGPLGFNSLSDVLQVCGRWLGWMLELAIGLGSHQIRLPSEFVEQSTSEDAPGTVIRIEQHPKSSCSNAVDIDPL
jgi:hypothetical protein